MTLRIKQSFDSKKANHANTLLNKCKRAALFSIKDKRLVAGLIMILFSGIGTYFLFNTHAESPAPFASSDAYKGTVTSPAAVVSDPTTSDGYNVTFGTNGAACPTGETGTPTNCVPDPPVTPASGKQWKLTYDEEFSGTALDTSKLTPCFDWNYGSCTSSFNDGTEHYEPGQIQITPASSTTPAYANLNADPLTSTSSPSSCTNTSSSDCTGSSACSNGGACTYRSGLLSTARPIANSNTTECNSTYLYCFTYGYVEATLQPLNTDGFMAAFWMLPATPSYSYNSEIDILEQLGKPDPTDMEMHYYYDGRSDYYSPNSGGSIGGVNNKNGSCTSSIDYSQTFHTYAVDWEPTYVAFYIDGVKCGQFTGSPSTPSGAGEIDGISDEPMLLILNQMVNTTWQQNAAVGLPSGSTASSDLKVENIRVFQQE